MRLAPAAALFVLGVALAFGAGVSPLNDSVLTAVVIASFAVVVALIARRQNHRELVLLLGVLLILAGVARVAVDEIDSSGDWFNIPADGERIEVTGWLSDDARRAGNGVRLHITVTSVNSNEASFPLTAFASGLTDTTGSSRHSRGFRYGDVYTFSGRFSVSSLDTADTTAGAVFTGVIDLVATNEGSFLRRAVAGMREWISFNLADSLSEPAASLAQTMLVNDRTGLSNELNLDFRESGTSHLLAISGLHVALVGGLALVVSAALFGRRGQYYLLIPFGITVLYAALAGFSPSVTRAAIMFSVSLLARASGRQNASLPAIGVAAAAMVLVTPTVLHSLSFQLSFAAIAGISVLTPRLQNAVAAALASLGRSDLADNRFFASFIAGIAVSIAATLVTWPLIAVNFGGAPIWGGLATVIMLPAVPLLIIISAISAIATGLSPAAGEAIGWPARLISEYLAEVASIFRDIPPGIIDTSGWTALTAILAYAAVALVFGWRRLIDYSRTVTTQISALSHEVNRKDLRATRGVPGWTVVVVVIVAAVAWTGAITASGSNELVITVFETDRGDMLLLRTPNGTTVLIDGGRDPSGAVRQLDAALPFWDRDLDLMLVTHPDADHIGGLRAVTERYDVDVITEAPTDHPSTAYAAWRRAMDERAVPPIILEAGAIIALDDEITLEVLAAGRPFPAATINDASIVTMLRYRDFSMLLTGDITSVMERRLIASGYDLRSTVLKVPHHGSDTSSTPDFLRAVDPEIAIVQVGTDNRFGHPTADVMARLQNTVASDRLFVTSRDGEVTVSTNGHTVRVESER